MHHTEAPADRCAIVVQADRRAAEPVSRLLFGKFSEHLGANLYGGLWAECLTNPGLDSLAALLRNPERALANLVARAPEQAAAVGRQVALSWLPVGDAEYQHLTDPVLSPPHAQLITARGDSPALHGLRQRLDLPLRRCRSYSLVVHAHALAGQPALQAQVRRADTGEVLATAALGPTTGEWRRLEAALELPAIERPEATELEFVIGFTGPGSVALDSLSLLPTDHLAGWDPEAVQIYRELRLPLLRFPGGNFVSGYHWQDGLGPWEQRPGRPNPAWDIPECNRVGVDETLAFCRLVGCEPLICINAGNGTPDEAAAWVEYCNGPTTSRYGALRAANGHREPYGVRYWEVGNELYGPWQIGHCEPAEYAHRYRAFHNAMQAADPTILFIANGQSLTWNQPLVDQEADILRSVSLHHLAGSQLPQVATPAEAFESLMACTWTFAKLLADQRAQLAKRLAEPRVAITELMIHLGPNHATYPGNNTLAEALYFSGILHTAIRAGDFVELICHTAVMNHGGGLRKVRAVTYPCPVHWAHYLYSTQDCLVPVDLTVSGPTFSVPERAGLPAAEGVPYLDALALTDDAGARLALFVANRHRTAALRVAVRLNGFAAAAEGVVTQLAGPSFAAMNSVEEPARVALATSAVAVSDDAAVLELPPHSLTRLELTRR